MFTFVLLNASNGLYVHCALLIVCVVPYTDIVEESTLLDIAAIIISKSSFPLIIISHLAMISGKKMSMSSDSGLSDNEGSSGDEQKRIPVKKIFSNQQALRKRIDDLNGMLKTMEQQRSELQAVLQIVKDWTEDLRAVNRTNLGVPYIRAIKQLLAKQRIALSSKKSDFNRRIDKLKDAEVPFTRELATLIQQLRKEVTCVARDQRKYSAKSVENIRQLQGRIIGTCSAILAVYYEE